MRELAAHTEVKGSCRRLTHLVKAHCPAAYQGRHLDKMASEARAVRTGDWGIWPISDAAIAYAALDVLMPLAVHLYMSDTLVSGLDALVAGLDRMPQTEVNVESDRLLDASSTPGDTVENASIPRDSKKRKLDSAAEINSDFFRMQRNRSTLPPNSGQKIYPEGSPDALSGLCLIVSGVLDSMTRDQFSDYVIRHGGRTVKSVTRKVTHLVTDHGEAGPSKLKKCSNFGIQIVGEDTILDIVAKSAGHK